MGLFDSVFNAVSNHAEHGGNGGLGDLISLVSSNPQLVQAALSLLGNDGASCGLAGLVGKFQQAGLGEVIGSWIGSGHNQAISAEQLGNVLGHDTLSGLAQQFSLGSSGNVAEQLASLLPGLVDKLTPAGHAPAGGVGDINELMGSLTSVFGR